MRNVNRPPAADSDPGVYLGNNRSGNPGAQTCFIATAAYGTPCEANVVKLRAFRERYLLPFAPGRWIVGTYYQTSPPIADFIRERPWARAITRVGLSPLVVIAGALTGDSANAVTVGACLTLCCVGFIYRRVFLDWMNRARRGMRDLTIQRKQRWIAQSRSAYLLLVCAMLIMCQAAVVPLIAADAKPKQATTSTTKTSQRCGNCGKAIEGGNLCPACTAQRQQQAPQSANGNTAKQKPVELKLPENFTLRDPKAKLPYETRGTRTDPRLMKDIEEARKVHGYLLIDGKQGLLRYGNWYGPNWGGGVDTTKNGGRFGNAAPVDSMDEAARRHDIAYARAEAEASKYREAVLKKEADRIFVSELEELGEIPGNWPKPPSDSQLAGNYRNRAIQAFKAKISTWDRFEEEWQKLVQKR